MVRSGVVPPQKPRPKGANRATSDEWKRNIRAILKARGMTYAQLGVLCGNTSSAGISQMLGPKGKSTRIMVEVHAALGLPPPDDAAGAAPIDDPNLSRLMSAWADLDEGKRALLAQIAENFARGT